MLKKTLKYFILALMISIFLCLLTPFVNVLKKRSIEHQIHFLSHHLDKGYDDVLQQRFPEGKIFSNALLALSVIEYCEKSQCEESQYAAIVDQCINRIQSKRAKSNFNKDLIPESGIFYSGWSNLVYSSYQSSRLYDYSKLKDEVNRESEKIVAQITQTQVDSLKILNSYQGGKWPADNLIAIASLDDEKLKQDWIQLLLNLSKHDSGLIHHVGDVPSEVRGSSSAMLTYCLGRSGYADVADYNQVFRDLFVESYLGVELVKENEDGSNRMSFDSGPVVFGYGASATIMNIKTQASLGNSHSQITWAAMNTLALPIHLFGKKFYLLQQEPMFDLFMLWAIVE